MGFSLRGLLKGVGSDLNVFDHGKSQGNPQGKPQPASTARPNIAQKVFSQLDPFDNNKTFKNAQGNGQNQSVVKQVAGFGKGAIEGTGLPFLINQDIVNPIKSTTAILSHNQVANNNANKFYQQPVGNQFKQLAGHSVQAGLTLAAPEIAGKFGELADVALPNASSSAIPGLIKLAGSTGDEGLSNLLTGAVTHTPITSSLGARLATGALANEITNTGFNVANQAITGQKVNVGQAAKQGLGATAFGVTTELVPHAANAIKSLGADQNGSIRLPFTQGQPGDTPFNIQNPGDARMSKPLDVVSGVPSTYNAPIKKTAGVPIEKPGVKPTTKLTGAAQQSFLSKAKSAFTPLGERGSAPLDSPVFFGAGKLAGKDKLITIKDSEGNSFEIPASQWDSEAGLPKELTAPPTPPKPGTDQYAEMMDNLPIIGQDIGNRTKLQSPSEQLDTSAILNDSSRPEVRAQTEAKGTQLQNTLGKGELDNGKSLPNSTTKGNKLQAITNMHDILNRGGTVDEAVSEYLNRTGATYGEAQLQLQKLFNDGTSLDKGSVNASLNPKFGEVKTAAVGAGNADQAILNAKSITDKVNNYGAKALNAIGKLSDNDHALLDNLRGNKVDDIVAKAENPQAFQQAANAVKDYNDYTHAAGSGLLGQNVPYRKNYGAPLYLDQSTPEAIATMDAAKAKLKLNPGYSKHRNFQDYNDAAQYGLSRKNANFTEDLKQDIQNRSTHLNQLTLHKGLEEAFPGQVKVGEIGVTPEGTYDQLKIAGGRSLSVPKEIADKINSREWVQSQNKAVQAYDKINPALKYGKLGLGGFHGFTEAGNFVGQQLASGKLLTEPTSTAKLFKVMFSEKAMQGEMREFAGDGTLDKGSLSGLTTRPEQILADANVGLKGKIAKYTGIKAVHDAVFGREIPYAKLKAFQQNTKNLSIDNPADVIQMRSIAKEINQNYGGINRAVEGLRPKEFQVLQRALLATDFTEGKIHTIADAVSKGGVPGKLARQTVVGKVLLFGGLAAAGGAIGGEYQGKDAKHIITDIAGKLADPSFEIGGYKVKTPSTHVSELVGAIKPYSQNAGAPWNGSGLLHYATSRSAALPSAITQLATNKDYYGQPFYGKNTKKNGGGAISLPSTAVNLAESVSPIAGSQVAKTAQGKQNVAAGAANIIGFNARPNPQNEVKLQGSDTILTDAQRKDYQGQLNPTLKTWQDKLKNSDAYKSASPNDQSNAMTQLKKDVTTSVDQSFSAKNNLGAYSPSSTTESKLSAKQKGVLDNSLDVSSYIKGSPAYKATTGSTKSPKQAKADTDFTNKSSDVSLALSRAKTKGDVNTWLNTAAQQYDSIEAYKKTLDPTKDHVKINSLSKQQDSLVTEAQKYQSQGGFTKPKKAKKTSSKSATKSKVSGFSAPKITSGVASSTALRNLVKNVHITRKKVTK